MIRVKLAEVLEKRGKTAYQLHKETGLVQSTVYDLAKQKGSRIDFNTLDVICRVLKCQPGELLFFEEDSERNER